MSKLAGWKNAAQNLLVNYIRYYDLQVTISKLDPESQAAQDLATEFGMKFDLWAMVFPAGTSKAKIVGAYLDRINTEVESQKRLIELQVAGWGYRIKTRKSSGKEVEHYIGYPKNR